MLMLVYIHICQSTINLAAHLHAGQPAGMQLNWIELPSIRWVPVMSPTPVQYLLHIFAIISHMMHYRSQDVLGKIAAKFSTQDCQRGSTVNSLLSPCTFVCPSPNVLRLYFLRISLASSGACQPADMYALMLAACSHTCCLRALHLSRASVRDFQFQANCAFTLSARDLLELEPTVSFTMACSCL